MAADEAAGSSSAFGSRRLADRSEPVSPDVREVFEVGSAQESVRDAALEERGNASDPEFGLRDHARSRWRPLVGAGEGRRESFHAPDLIAEGVGRRDSVRPRVLQRPPRDADLPLDDVSLRESLTRVRHATLIPDDATPQDPRMDRAERVLVEVQPEERPQASES